MNYSQFNKDAKIKKTSPNTSFFHPVVQKKLNIDSTSDSLAHELTHTIQQNRGIEKKYKEQKI